MSVFFRRKMVESAPDWTILFGKLPVCAEFVQYGLVSDPAVLLDRWYRHAYQIFLQKHTINSTSLLLRMQPYHFLYANGANQTPIVGSVFPSHDLGGRAYPFVCGRLLHDATMLEFNTIIPLVYSLYFVQNRFLFDAVKKAESVKDVKHTVREVSAIGYVGEKREILECALSKLRGRTLSVSDPRLFLNWLIQRLRKLSEEPKKEKIMLLLPLPMHTESESHVVFYLQLLDALFSLTHYEWQTYWNNRQLLFSFQPLSSSDWCHLVCCVPSVKNPYDFFAHPVVKDGDNMSIDVNLSLFELLQAIVANLSI